MDTSSVLDPPIIGFSKARSAGYTIESRLLNLLAFAIPGARHAIPRPDRETEALVQKDLLDLLERDGRNISRGLYPLQVLRPESPVEHLKRIPRVVLDGLKITFRRNRGRTTEFKGEARELLGDLPRYYRRNFHFQTDGYLSRESAELYEHQVEILFGGAADAMRRLILPPLRERFGNGKGEGLRFLEIGAGTGRATRFVSLAFPRAKIVATDLSSPYLKVAQERLRDRPNVDFLQADGGRLPFRDGEFDAAYSVFLYHELPREEREAVLRESARVLKPGGFAGFVDSIQLGERPEFDGLLGEFPKTFHEPFYRDYVSHPMDKLLEAAGFRAVSSERGFFSKAGWGTRA
jgi:ubiquinone/menaquinone biosynthesis C-methylase UbiE